jgi:hypothetical protein
VSSPSTHQGSPKVSKQVARLWFCPACGMRMAGLTYSVDESRVSCSKTKHKAVAVAHEFIPVSALLSDEVVEAVAKSRYERQQTGVYGHRVSWSEAADEIKQRWLSLARADLQAAIEQVGGGQGGE